MAEVDFDDEELIEGFEEDVSDLDEGQDDLALESQSGVQSFLTPARMKIMAIVLGSVFLLGGTFFAFSFFGGSDSNELLTPQQQAQKKKEAERKRRRSVKYVKLFDGLAISDLTPLVRELSFADILFTTNQKGNNYTLLVDEKEQDRARTLLAIKGLPSGGSRGYELLDDSQTLGVTEFDKRIRFLRALSGELERAIIQFDAVEQCKVQIVLPEQRLFSVTQPPVTASVLIRRTLGQELTDDNVFSIIQLMSNAVENLQQENVSVIDTEGQVLSIGIFDRMAARAAGEVVEEVEDTSSSSPEFSQGTPIIPKFKDIQQWLEIKQEYETSLEDKAIKQLFGILPLASFKLVITADINPQRTGEAIVPTRITTSMVVDVSNEDVFLDQLLKRQIFNTIAGAIGYERGRDTIQLSKADFLVFSKEEMDRLKELRNAGRGWITIAIASVVGLVLAMGLLLWRRRQSLKKENMALPLQTGADLDTVFVLENLSVGELVQKLKDSADMYPTQVARVMDGWLKSEQSEDDLETLSDDALSDQNDDASPDLPDFDAFTDQSDVSDLLEER